MNLFNLVATLKLNSDDFTRKLNESSENIKKAAEKQKEAFEKVDRVVNGKVAKSFEKSGKMAKKLGDTIDKYVVRGLAGVSAGLATFVAVGIKSNGVMEQSQTAWTTLLGSQEEAIKMLRDISDYAAKTPFTKMGVDTMAKQLKNAGFQGQELFDQLTKFGDMGSAFAIQEDSLKEMVRQYAQVQQAGIAYTEDLNILQDRGIPIYKALSETLGVTVGDIKKMTSEGELTAETYNNALNSIAESTKGAMEAQSQTASGLFSTIKDNTLEVIRILSEPLFDKFKEGLEEVAKFVDKARESSEIFVKGMNEGKSVSEAFADAIKEVFGDDAYNKIKNVGDIVFWATTAFVGFRLALLGMQVASGVIALINGVNTAMLLYKAGLSVTTAIQMAFNFSIGLIPLLIGAAILAVVGLAAIIIKNWDAIKQKTLELADNFREWALNLREVFVNKVKEMVDKVVTFFSELPGKISKWFSETVDKVVGWMKDMSSKAWDGAKKVVKTIAETISELPGKMLDIGSNIVKGLWEGITGMGSWLTGKISGFFGGIVDKVKGIFDQHSPSKVFEQIGVYNVEGLALGTQKQMKKSEKIIERQMMGIIPEKEEVYNYNGNFQGRRNNNYNVTVNYTGKVEDEFELRRKLSNDIRRLALS